MSRRISLTCPVAQGVLGSVLIKLNAAAAAWRRQSIWHEWPVLEVLGVSAVTAAISYLVRHHQDLNVPLYDGLNF